jgi:hypothetical protein
MESIVTFLGFLLGPVPIVDRTGLTGLYDMTFMVDEISPSPLATQVEVDPGQRVSLVLRFRKLSRTSLASI